jgi:hypothetical protein
MLFVCYELTMQILAIRPNLELKICPKQLLGSLPLDIALPAATNNFAKVNITYDLIIPKDPRQVQLRFAMASLYTTLM